MLRICTLSSGSSGNSICIESERTKILIDAGISARQLTFRLAQAGISAHELSGILITHEHSDHVKGLRVFASKYSIPVYSTDETWYYLPDRSISGYLHRSIESSAYFGIGDLEISSFPIPHDAVDPIGFTVSQGGKTLSLVTDIGHVPDYLRDRMKDSSLVFLESNHDIEVLKRGSYPAYLKRRILGDRGHLSNESAAEVIGDLARGKMKQVVLGHLSKNNNTPELAFAAVESKLSDAGCRVGEDIDLYCCSHGEMGSWFTVR